MGIISSKRISLALDSGSAKGMAHIGIIEELIRSGYKISSMSGTSMGAVVAAYYCMGKLEVLKEWLMGLNKKSTFMTMDFSLTGGFIGGKKLLSAFEDHLGSATFENSKIPLYIVATNLTTGEERVFSKGLIVPAIRASISVPGVMKPYFYENDYYVDGAVTNPLPVDVLHANGHKNIVAAHLHEFLDKRDEKAPGVLETMSRSMSIVSRYLAKAKINNAFAVIEPDLSDFDMFHFYQAREIIEKGRYAARHAIDTGMLDSLSMKLLNSSKDKITKIMYKIYERKNEKSSY